MDQINEALEKFVKMYHEQTKLRAEAYANFRCMPSPIGCGGPVESFRDTLSQREYYISGLCQKCQDQIFKESSTS